MNYFFTALQFLTILPVRPSEETSEKEFPAVLAYFPLAGLTIGLLLAAAHFIFQQLHFDALLSSVLLVATLTILTGGLHLDGLADTADALMSRKPKKEMLSILRDSRIGVMGALSLIITLLLKVSLIQAFVPGSLPKNLILMCVISRLVQVVTLYAFPYARQEGKAKVFIGGLNARIVLVATVFALLITVLLAPFKGIVIFFTVAALVLLINRSICKLLGGITGDTVGAVSEISEIMVLFGMYIFSF